MAQRPAPIGKDRELPVEFFTRPTLKVARELLGTRLCHRLPTGELRSGRIVEVEAYLGLQDKASHARLQRRGGVMVPTPRTTVMFGPGGFAYVYFVYGMHTCFNVVAHAEGEVGAILVRALDPEPPLLPKSCRGPARLCAALAIERRHNGWPLSYSDSEDQSGDRSAERLWIAAGEPVADAAVQSGPRIGVAYAGDDALLPYRLGLRGHPHLSRPI